MIAHTFRLLLLLAVAASPAFAQQKPANVVFIYVDDLGYGDISANGSTTIRTPNIDRLAKEGLRFTDAHAGAATCTPSRYALLTGEYAFRKPGTNVLPGDAALIIEPGRTTLPSILRKAGYATAVVGKWHLGLGPKGGPDWNGEIRPSPLDVGFDYSFIMAATTDRVPTVYIDNRRVANLDPADPIRVSYTQPFGNEPTGKANPELLKMAPSHGHDMTIVNGISRIGFMTGGKAALWKDEEMGTVFTRKALDFIERQQGKPFFLYFATHEPHVPRVPHPRFVGKSGMGPRGDAILEVDWEVGELLSTLDRLKLANDTLVVFTSDNGPVVDDGYKDDAVEKLGDHTPAGPFRGGKYSHFEGGTRVPFIVRWPVRVKAGVSDALVSQVDLLASFAALTGQTLAAEDGPDSLDHLSAFLGQSRTGRHELVEQAGGQALRIDNWKYIPASKRAKMNVNTNTELGNDTVPQLYDLAADPGEKRNVADQFPDRVKQMDARLEELRKAGRSRPAAAAQDRARPPNILVAIADDWSYPHAGAYGDRTVSTPAFDRVAREGALFTRAFTAAPSCTPSRAALLTGQAIHRLAEGGNLHGFLPERFAVYPDLLEGAGYAAGFTGKGWGPGQFEPGGRSRNPAGPRFDDFEKFLDSRRAGQPFVFWYGSTDPHRPYEAGSGAQAGLKADTVAVPPFLPDTPEVRGDLLDYYFEVQRFDSQVAKLLDTLERRGELDNTIVIVTSDNGMPFPRAKANLYDAGTRMPLAIRWPGRIKPGTTVDAFVSHLDLAPTLLEASGVRIPADMTGHSLLPLVRAAPATQTAQVDRSRVFVERERHANVRRGDLSYPARAVRTADYLYIHNFRPDRWPAGDPELYVAVGPFGDIDDGPSKQLLMRKRTDDAVRKYFELATAKRPAEELYDLKKDPGQLVNVAAEVAYASIRERLRKELDEWERTTGDPRATEDDDRWDTYPYYGAPAKQEGRGGNR